MAVWHFNSGVAPTPVRFPSLVFALTTVATRSRFACSANPCSKTWLLPMPVFSRHAPMGNPEIHPYSSKQDKAEATLSAQPNETLQFFNKENPNKRSDSETYLGPRQQVDSKPSRCHKKSSHFGIHQGFIDGRQVRLDTPARYPRAHSPLMTDSLPSDVRFYPVTIRHLLFRPQAQAQIRHSGSIQAGHPPRNQSMGASLLDGARKKRGRDPRQGPLEVEPEALPGRRRPIQGFAHHAST